MLLKQCSRCKELVEYGHRYCDRCAPIVQQERMERMQQSRKRSNQRYNQKRDLKYVRFYNSSAWRAVAGRRLELDGYRCVMCKAIAAEVDHIQEIQTPDGWERRLDIENTRSLCHACHDKRHGRFKTRNKAFKSLPEA